MNIQGNEDADKAAKLAAARDVITFKSVPFLDTKFYSKKYIFNTFQNYWSSIRTNQKLRNIKPNISLWPSLHSTNRRDIRVLNRLRIGHTHLTHKFLFQNPQVMPKCTVQHILLDCVYLANSRIRWKFLTTLENPLYDIDLYNLI